MTVLQKILATKREELRRWALPLPSPPSSRSVSLSRAAGAPLGLIAEIKHRSPSAGELDSTLSVAARARAYERAGAAMVSVLVDAPFFGGSYEHLAQVRQSCSLPVLCKEFIVDQRQLDAARAYGADYALLIVRCLTPDALSDLIRQAESRQMTPLVEVHTRDDVRIALDAGAQCLGVNARDLDTLQMDAERAQSLLNELPEHLTRLYLSGLTTAQDVRDIASHTQADAALVGEALMRQSDPEPLLASMVQAARPRAAPAPARGAPGRSAPGH